MSFEWPLALLALLVVPLLVVAYVLRERRRAAAAARFASIPLLPNLVERAPGRRRHLPPALMLLALSAMLVGVARPHATISVPREEATVVLAIDVSRSMTATDVRPSRLAAARAAALAFVRQAPAKFRIGLVSFESRALAAVPPTEDREPVEAGLAALRPGESTALGDAISLALDLASGSPRQRSGPPAPAAVLLISDGAQTAGRAAATQAAQRARSLRTPVYTIALGTPEGVVERTLVGGFREITRVPPQPEALRAVARASGGEFFAAADQERLRRVYERLGSRLGRRKQRREVSDLFSAAAAALVLGGGALSTLWFRRVL